MAGSSLGASLSYIDFHLLETVELLQALRTLFVDLIPGTG